MEGKFKWREGGKKKRKGKLEEGENERGRQKEEGEIADISVAQQDTSFRKPSNLN